MAYEDMTYEAILQRMMDRVTTDYPNLDNREGSIIFNALAPAAVELAIMYVELNNALSESFVRTASREYVLIACEQVGMNTSVFNASAGVHKGVFNVEVPIGSRWNCDLYNYTVTEYLGLTELGHTYRMDCDTVGTAPNNQTGDLTPITDAPTELTSARVIECLIPGENETSDEKIKEAYYDYVRDTATDGNVNQYKRWCSEYPNIGRFKVIPLWNGANTVKVSILNSNNRAASTGAGGLVDEFQKYLDPGSTGMGNGVAPIGAVVTVTTAEEVLINVEASVTLKDDSYDTTDVQTAIENAIENYFKNIAYEKQQISYMSIGAVILDVDGVESVDNVTLLTDGDHSPRRIELGEEQIPVFADIHIDWTVV